MSKFILGTTDSSFYCFIRNVSVISQHKINCQLINIGLKCNIGESIIKNYSKKQNTWDLTLNLSLKDLKLDLDSTDLIFTSPSSPTTAEKP